MSAKSGACLGLSCHHGPDQAIRYNSMSEFDLSELPSMFGTSLDDARLLLGAKEKAGNNFPNGIQGTARKSFPEPRTVLRFVARRGWRPWIGDQPNHSVPFMSPVSGLWLIARGACRPCGGGGEGGSWCLMLRARRRSTSAPFGAGVQIRGPFYQGRQPPLAMDRRPAGANPTSA